MKRKQLLFCIFIGLIAIKNYSQNVLNTAFLITDSLKTNANTIIRSNITDVTINSVNSITIKRRRVVTVLNELGNKNINLYQHYNNDTEIKELSVKIYDALGKEIKKISEKKFTDVSAADGFSLYSDAKVKYFDYTPTSYPYTVVFKSETHSSSTGFIPDWYPISGYLIGLKKSTYVVNNPTGLEIRKKEVNFDGFPVENLSTENKIHYELKNQPAKKYERYSLPFFDIMPNVSCALNNFTLKKVSGQATNWKEFGSWMQSKLLTDKVILDEATKSEVNTLVKDAKTNEEKARIIYNYMQNKTRYISVQIGIGGWEPMTAKEVDKLGYGDCKGLSNYMKALLLSAGVASNYTIVYADERRDIDTDFASIQGNHAILNIPNNGNDIWLECTSQKVPFGFLGDFTDDRNVLVITPEGGVIKRTPAYKNETNLQTVKATITLDDNGNVIADVERVSKGIQYDRKYHIESKPKDELEKYYLSNVWDYNNNLKTNSIVIDNNKKDVVFTEKLNVAIDGYATINNNEYLVRLNAFNKFSHIPKRYRKRTQPVQIERGFLDEDEFTFKIPNAYRIDKLPLPKEINTKFGSYKISVEKIDDNTLLYKKYFLLKEGTHPKQDYKKYRSFLKSVARYENSRIALLKK